MTACNYVGEDDDTTDTDNSLCEFAELSTMIVMVIV